MNDNSKAASLSPFSKSEAAGEPDYRSGPRELQPFAFLDGKIGDFRMHPESDADEQANPKDVSAMEIASEEQKPKPTEEVTPAVLAAKQPPAKESIQVQVPNPVTESSMEKTISSQENKANPVPPTAPLATPQPIQPPSAPESKSQ